MEPSPLPAKVSIANVNSLNSAAMYVCLSGATKQFDQNSLIHAIWHHLARLKIHVWVERVPTKLNIADLPSRESYDLLNRIGAKWVPAHLGVAFRNAQTWESLSILGLK